MRIVFCGEDVFSAGVLESLIFDDHQIMAVFCPRYKNHIHARLQLICNKYDIDFYRTNDINSENNEAIIKELRPDIITVCHFQKILKKNIIDIPAVACINLHPSLLPKYRGLSPQHWPIINGDEQTGITVHYINEGIDTGDIILQQRIAIEPDMYVLDLQIQMLKTYKSIVRNAIRLLSEQRVSSKKQTSDAGTYYGKLKETDCLIDIEKGHIAAYNLIRGVSKPYFGASFDNYKIWKANIASKAEHKEIKKKFKDNKIYENTAFGTFLKFNDGSLMLKKYNKINMTL